jgi:hypothetical protein
MSSLEFDPEGFARAVDEVMQDRADQLQAVYDRFFRRGEARALKT